MTSPFDNNAVSETLGNILVFGLIVSCIGLVLLTGNQIIADTEESISFQSLEQSFSVVSSDLKNTAFQASPVMTTRIKLDYGTLKAYSAQDSGRMIVVKYDGRVYEMPIGALEFQSSDYGQSICIEDGAIVKKYSTSGSIMTSPPRMFYSPSTKTLMIAVVNENCAAASQSGGVSNIQSKYMDFSRVTFSSTSQVAVICVKSDYGGAWKGYFEDDFKPAMTLHDTDDAHWTNYTLANVENVIIGTYNISVSLV